jgi:hypothetical protein
VTRLCGNGSLLYGADAPTAVASPSSNSYSVTITNDPSTTSSQKMGSATVVVPAGFTITSSFTVTATGGKHWDAALVSGVIQLVANPGTQKLDFGESVTVTFNATAPTWQPAQPDLRVDVGRL